MNRMPTNRTLTVLNPNTSESMTAAVVAQVQARVPPGWQVRGWTARTGAPVIDSPATFAAAAEAWPARLADQPPAGALLLACFGDPGLETLRRAVAPQPLVGLAEAAVVATAGRRFAILTAGPAWVPMLKARVADFGAARALTGVHALPVNGLALAREPQRFRAELRAAAEEAECAGAEALILGGAAFAGLAGTVETSLAVIDAIDVATAQLVAQGVGTA